MTDFFASNLTLIQATFVGFALALSIQVPLRLGVFSLAGAGAFGLSAYATALLVLKADMPALPALAVSVVGSTLVVLLLGLVVYRLSGIYLAMATVAFDLIVGVVALNGDPLTGGSTGLYGVLTDFDVVQMIVLLVVVVVVLAATERGRTGRRVDAVREDPELAASLGVNVRRYRLSGFAAGGALGALAGGMAVLTRSAISPPDVGFSLIVLALTMIVVGGTRSWAGALIGAVLFTWLPTLLTAIGEWQDLVYGVIVTLAAIFLPRGIHGVVLDAVRRSRRRPPDADGASAADGGPDVPATEATEADRAAEAFR
ncbi:branched-chain amino acid ABC transporter permease [Pseudonocardia ailaonensis]|uniref:Branched-chain amino acid ABC transporter permease n=1 Tax=Pseudonocardia ailaonensis TaxID=367279 RepID=A0ABN2N5Z5_9PSEU